MGQSWLDLLFAHWPVPEATLRPAVPAVIPIESFDGTAWTGVTPFEIIGAHLRGLPPLPWLSRFPELNVRAYTTIGGRPGIWFFSLDARPHGHSHRRPTRRSPARIGTRTWRSRAPAARSARSRARRVHATLVASDEPSGPASAPAPGTLEHFLTERYYLYTLDVRDVTGRHPTTRRGRCSPRAPSWPRTR